MSHHPSRAVGLLLGVAADAAFGDPRRGHPVALFGAYAARLEPHCYGDSRAAGVRYAVACVAPVLALGAVVERATRGRPVVHALATAAATWAVLGARTLRATGKAMADALDVDDLDAARAALPSLCGRSPEGLDAGELGRATVESLAENTADAAVASLCWGAVAGVPGLLVHRAANTLDAMVGHRTPRYARFGTASARLDDLLDYVPARVTGLLASGLAPSVGGDARRAWRSLLAGHARHPSPNGGWCEAAWAGALGVRLGGRNVYASGVEVRPTLGDESWPKPGAREVRAASRLVTRVTLAAAALGAGFASGVAWSAGRRRSGVWRAS